QEFNGLSEELLQLCVSQTRLKICGPVDHGSDQVMSIGAKLREILFHGHFFTALAPPQPGESRIGCETEEPGSKRCLPAKRMRLPIHSQKASLDNLSRFRGIPKETSGLVKPLVTTLSERGVKRRCITRL